MTIERYRMIRRFSSKGFPGVVLFLLFINLTSMGYASEAPIRTALEFRKVVETRTSESNDVIESINIPDPTSSTFRSRSHMGSHIHTYGVRSLLLTIALFSPRYDGYGSAIKN